jgi:Putative zinc-finger
MTHDTCGGLLSAYIDGELDADLRFDVEVHLRTCRACRTSVQELTAVRDCLSNAPSDSAGSPPPWAEIQRALVRRDTRGRAPWAIVRGVAAAAAAVALIAITSDLVERPSEPVARSTSGRGADAATTVAARELEQFIHANREHLTPAMYSASDQTIEVLNGAIRDVRSSLVENPEDPFLALYLARLERMRIAALRSFAMTVGRTS